jgi:adenosylcobyric acid synthase
MKGIMIQGTASDVGKSYITTAICRILANKGYKVAPFKSQNMSNNSYVTADGKEIGRAQGVQAEAAKQAANVHMNPILLKPKKDTESEIVLHGEVFKSYDGFSYRNDFCLSTGLNAVKESLKFIEDNYDYVVIEGAGSPSEVNLNDKEIVNMRVAEAADVDVILVADIDRGGSFGSIVGTLELVFEHRHRIKGVIFNKFRGDIRLLQDGLDWVEEYTGVKVLGVIPYLDDVYVEVEDAQSNALENSFDDENPLDIVVIHMERVSNNTDLEPFIHERDTKIRIVRKVSQFGNPDAVIIPGTKSTIADLETLKDSGLADKIKAYYQNGGTVFGICGGYQALGQKLVDPHGVDNEAKNEVEGLSILPVVTTFEEIKNVRLVKGLLHSDFKTKEVSGYEIHLGKTEATEKIKEFAVLEDGTIDGCVINEGQVIGTYLHNIFHNDTYRNEWLNNIRLSKGLAIKEIVDTSRIKEDSYEKLAEIVEQHLDMNLLTELINK